MSDSLINKGDIAQHAAAESIDRSAYLPATPWLATDAGLLPVRPVGMAGNLNDILIAQFKKASICRIPRPRWCNRSSSSVTS